MDGQNFQNGQTPYNEQSVQTEQSGQPGQSVNYYQDNTNSYHTPYTEYYQRPQQEPTNPLAVAGLVLGIIAIPFACCYGIGVVFGIAGIICSALSKKSGQSSIGTAGLICSIIGTALSVLMIIFYVIYILVLAGILMS